MNAENPTAFPSGDFTGLEPGYGMTLRDWFAGQVIGGLASTISRVPTRRGEARAEAEARYAYERADAMLEARKALGQ